MTAQAVSTPAPVLSRAGHTPVLSVLGTLRSEWIKLWSLRTTYWTLALTAAAYVALAALLALLLRNPDFAQGDPSFAQLPFAAGVYVATIPLLVLGTLTITGEYSTGQVRSSLVAVPIRLRWLAAKLAVLTGTAAVVVAATVAIATVAVTLILSGTEVKLDLSDPETLRVIGGGALYLVTIMVLAFGVGALLRNSGAALGVVLGFLLIVEQIVAIIAMFWKPMQAISPFLPGSAGARLTTSEAQLATTNAANVYDIHLSAWQGYGVLVAWVVVVLALAAVRLRTRDA
jgi:ABC-2 type transport system permease protein